MTTEESLAKSMGLQVWEFRLWGVMCDLQNALKCNDELGWWVHEHFNLDLDDDVSANIPPAELAAFWQAKQKELAGTLGAMIADELLRPNYQVLRVAAEGWANLNNGKPFKNQSGRLTNKYIVHGAFIGLAFQNNSSPSMDEVIAYLAGLNPPVKMSKGRLSKLVDELQMKGWLRDERLAKNRYKKAKG